jgi:hypothetical protein
VTANAISISISVGALLLQSAAPPMSRAHLMPTLTSVITSVQETTSKVVVDVAHSVAATSDQFCCFPKTACQTTQLRESLWVPSTRSPDTAVILALCSIQGPESIATVCFSIAIVGVNFMH